MERIPLEMVREFCTCLDRAEIVRGGLVFHRFPAAFHSLYDSESSRVRMQCPSGVRIRFVSDTLKVGLTLRYGEAARSLYRGTLVVDGDLFPWGPDHFEAAWEGEIYHVEERKDRVFDLWLPHLCAVDVMSLTVDTGAGCRPAPPLARHWLALGDSITQGMTASLPTRTHTSILSLANGLACRNLGVGGTCFDERLAQLLPALPADFITVAYGTNDFAHSAPLETVRAGAAATLDGIARLFPGTPVFLVTPVTWVDAPDGNDLGLTFDVYRQIIREVGSHRPHVHLVHGEDMVPDDSTCFVDKVHPNNRGFAIYAENLAEVLRDHTALDIH